MLLSMSRRCIELRKAKGWTQAELGHQAGGLDQSHISNFERGEGKVTLRSIRKIAEALGVPIVELFMDERDAAEATIFRYIQSLDEAEKQFWVLQAQAKLGDAQPSARADPAPVGPSSG